MAENIEIDLKEFLRSVVKRWWIIVLCAVICGSSVLIYTLNFVKPEYKATISMYVNNNSSKETLSSGDLAVALRLVETYVNIIRSDRVVEKVIDESRMQLTPVQVRGMISAQAVGETEMFKVTVTTPNRQQSADLANAIADVAVAEIPNIIQGSSVKVIDYAKVPSAPSGPNYTTNALLGAAAGIGVAVLGILVQMLLDVRVKNEDDLKRISSIPVLGAIPEMNTGVKKSGKNARR